MLEYRPASKHQFLGDTKIKYHLKIGACYLVSFFLVIVIKEKKSYKKNSKEAYILKNSI